MEVVMLNIAEILIDGHTVTEFTLSIPGGIPAAPRRGALVIVDLPEQGLAGRRRVLLQDVGKGIIDSLLTEFRAKATHNPQDYGKYGVIVRLQMEGGHEETHLGSFPQPVSVEQIRVLVPATVLAKL